MPNPAGTRDVERFRALLARHLGLQFDDTKLGFLAEVFQRRLKASENVNNDYLATLEASPARQELAALALELTVPETYFLRNMDQFRAFAAVAIPDRMRVRASQQCLRFLSVGCASGEEPYSIAIVTRQAMPESLWDVSINAIDINSAMLEKAARARYSAWALRETPPDVQRRWFKQSGSEFILDDVIRRAVKFKELNLVEDNAEIWQPNAYDVVFCRNVLMYFSPQFAQTVIARITRSLAPGGYLFLGHAETLRGLSHDFHLRHTHDTFYYQRKADLEAAAPPILPGIVQATYAAPALHTLVDGADSWVDAIGRAAERIRALTDPQPAAANQAAIRTNNKLGLAFDLLRQERFDEARELVETLPPESARDVDVLLLHAVLLTHGGKLARAEAVCEQLLAFDALNAGAHYVLALCREGAGDPRGAVDHDQAASYLDPTFAMPRLHLGLLARKGGNRGIAQRELEQALVLLKREDASRLLLFGGGFSREALIALCEAERIGMGDAA